jgi:pyruvate/2-oxoglutarate/acetoin dehydrogenase E1 component/TPP-dependent pyruvate/acetoin dehydrogenase alpha subunit
MKKQTAKSQLRLGKQDILFDFYHAHLSRTLSRMLRQEVHTGRAKFGAGNSGKELPLIAMARAFQKGDFYAGYYRDQTFMFAKEVATPEDFFTTLYGDAVNDPHSGGRQMSNHYITPFVDEKGEWQNLTRQFNISSPMAPVAGQLTHAIGLAYASKVFRENTALQQHPLSNKGNEVCFCTIGDAATSEGVFFEAVNAAGVMQIPIAFIVLDDGYGISVPTKYQTTKGSISDALEGFQKDESGQGLDIYRLKAWDYPSLYDTFQKGIEKIRKTHTPAIFHVQECTQPLGHSTSGSHERYKSEERLAWEAEFDGLKKMEEFLLQEGLVKAEELEEAKENAQKRARLARKKAWELFREPIEAERKKLLAIYDRILEAGPQKKKMEAFRKELEKMVHPVFSHMLKNAKRAHAALFGENNDTIPPLQSWIKRIEAEGREHYSSQLYSESPRSALKVPAIPASYVEGTPEISGFEVLNAFFDQALDKYPELLAFGEDVGKIGGVNQAFNGLQEKYGELRVFDTGIREWTIVGQGMGMAMRGLRPIAELQYLDYLAYAFSPLTDDVATLRYRTKGKQSAPVIIRTRGHRLEGIWHSGSPIGMLLHSMRGIYVLVPRNMTQAAGMYNTMLQSDDPAILIECLNGYRLKEKLPVNLDEFTVPLGKIEVLQEGVDVTLVTYGSCVRIAQEGMRLLWEKGISVELIDVQTLLPFDLGHEIVESLKKTNRIVLLDEDVPGGASAYMLQQVLEQQGGYQYLDSPPVTISAKAHRPAFTDDGDYFSKPQAEEVYEQIFAMMLEAQPGRFS